MPQRAVDRNLCKTIHKKGGVNTDRKMNTLLALRLGSSEGAQAGVGVDLWEAAACNHKAEGRGMAWPKMPAALVG